MLIACICIHCYQIASLSLELSRRQSESACVRMPAEAKCRLTAAICGTMHFTVGIDIFLTQLMYIKVVLTAGASMQTNYFDLINQYTIIIKST